MSTFLRKCLDIAPSGILNPGAANDYRNLRGQPWWPELRESISHIRILADWPSIQPVAGVDPWDFANNPGRSSAHSLDEHVRLATEDGLRVILVPYRYARWANGTDGFARDSEADLLFEPWDRLRFRFFEPWYRDRRVARPGYKEVHYRMPDEGHGPDTAWGRYVAALWDRYVGQAPAHGRIAAFEVVNEPNYQLWPQRGPAPPADPAAGELEQLQARFQWVGADMVVQRATAEMMATVDALARRHGGDVLCLAPATSDTTDDIPRIRSVIFPSVYGPSFDSFVDRLLDELERIDFRGGEHWGWSFHNYADVERDGKRAQLLRERLRGRWRGRQLDGGAALYATEGGCRLSQVRARFGATLPAERQRELQAAVIREAVTRHHHAKGDGAGVALWTQYTTFADEGFDCGLLEAAKHGGARRPAFGAWAALPEYAPGPLRPAAWRPQP